MDMCGWLRQTGSARELHADVDSGFGSGEKSSRWKDDHGSSWVKM